MKQILKRILLPNSVIGQGKTTHFRQGELVSPKIAVVELAKIDGADGIYVFYYSENGEELNDLYFDDLPTAMRQISKEFSLDAVELERTSKTHQE